MPARIKSGLSLLLMLLLFVVSSRAAVCELACGLGAQSVLCHTSGALAKEGDKSSPTLMSQGHCMPAMHGNGSQEQSTVHARAFSFTGIHDVQCHHDFAPAIEGTSAASLHLTPVHWSVVEVVPVAAILPDILPVDLESLPPRYTPANSRFITLRI